MRWRSTRTAPFCVAAALKRFQFSDPQVCSEGHADRQVPLSPTWPRRWRHDARLTREREKVRAMMDADRRLEQIIVDAGRTRLAAIAGDLEAIRAILALEPEDQAPVATEYGDVLWDRLTMVEPAALAVQEEKRTALEPAAWRAVLPDLAEGGEASAKSLACCTAPTVTLAASSWMGTACTSTHPAPATASAACWRAWSAPAPRPVHPTDWGGPAVHSSVGGAAPSSCAPGHQRNPM